MDTPFIYLLPPELLVAIATFITDQSTIFRLATVCRHWHDALTGTAALWTSIDCRSESRTSILLQRSKSTPIDVTVDCVRYAPEAVSLVANYTHRMRSIDVTLSSRALKDFHSLLHGLAPILKTMRMQALGSLGFPQFRYPPYSSFFQGQFSALRTLCLEGYPFDLVQSAPTMTNSLTTLVLDNQQPHHLRALLEYLGHCKNLEHLKIVLPYLRGIAPASRIVSLSNLRELEFVRSSSTALCHLSFPPSTDLTIQSDVSRHSGRYPLVDTWTQRGLLHIFESRTITSIKMGFIGPNCVVALLGSHLTLTVQASTNHSRLRSFHSDCLVSFQFFPIQTTKVSVLIRSPSRPFTGTLRQQSCAQLLKWMPALEQIILDVSFAPFFIRALEPVDGDLLCPKLRGFILIRRSDHKLNIWSNLQALSNQRKDHGCPLMCRRGSYSSSGW